MTFKRYLKYCLVWLLALLPMAALSAVPTYTGFTSRPTGYVVTAADWNGDFGNFINHVNTYVIGNLNLLNVKGNLLSFNGAVIEALSNAGAGDNGKALQLDSTTSTGLKWAAIASTTALTTKGDVLCYSTNLDRLPIGVDGSALVADSTQSTGLRWSTGVFPTGGIVLWSGTIASIPVGWHLCDGTAGTPNLQGLFIAGAGNVSPAASSGMGLMAPGGPYGDASAGAYQGPIHAHYVSGSASYGTGGTVAAPGGFTGFASVTPRFYSLAYIQKI